jgi:hypothetical protein
VIYLIGDDCEDIREGDSMSVRGKPGTTRPGAGDSEVLVERLREHGFSAEAAPYMPLTGQAPIEIGPQDAERVLRLLDAEAAR